VKTSNAFKRRGHTRKFFPPNAFMAFARSLQLRAHTRKENTF
jgi:hypothetical protein